MRPVKMCRRSRKKKFSAPRVKVLPSKMFPLLKCRLSMLHRKMPEMKAGS